MTSEETPQGWIIVDISEANENWAKAQRAERDKLYGNIYRETATDERWVGDLGELVFDKWLKKNQVEGYTWMLDDAAGAPDFIFKSGIRIGVKTVKRNVPMRDGYTAQITARHAEEPIEQFFFMSYEIKRRRMWLLGGIDKQSFLSGAIPYEGGQSVHGNYKVRSKHKILNIDVGKLIPPVRWIASLR